MNNQRVLMKGLFALFLLMQAGAAFAETTFFGEDLAPLTGTPNSDTARNQFLGSLSGAGTEDFEGFTESDTAPLQVDFGAAGIATLTGSGVVYDENNLGCCGRFATSGVMYWETNANFIITFSQPQAAVGFYGTDIGDFAGQLSITYVNGVETTVDIPHTIGAPDGSALYFGLIADTDFTSIEFSNSSGDDYFGFDDFTFAPRTQVSESVPTAIPATNTLGLLLLVLLFAGAGYSVLRRRVIN